jgi:SNF2 family DNA or RNA helicase
MEPGFNPALELQAIGRVHRLGQKRKVEVIRLLIVDTVETRIHKFLNKKYEKKSSPETEASTLEKPDEKKEDNTVGPVGNLSSERPKSKILAEEFDILFGVETKEDSVGTSDVHMPDAAIAAGFV